MKQESWIGRNNRMIAIIRVSSKGQDGNTSFDTQRTDAESYARVNGLDLVDAIPIVESAKNSEQRREYDAIIRRALKHKIQHLGFYNNSREARNLTNTEENEERVKRGEFVLHYIAERKVLHKDSPDSDFFMRDFHAVSNKHHSRDLSSKVKRAQNAKAESGWWPGCRPPDGYVQTKAKGDRGHERRRGSIIIPDTTSLAAKRVIREFQIRAERPTPSLREIRDRIVGEGLVTTSELKTYRAATIERRLKNVFYDGRFIWQGVEYIGNHEKIIDRDLFLEVQRTFGIKTAYGKNEKALFGRGWIRCADPKCGCVITFDPKTKIMKSTGETKTFKYYRCSNGKRVHQSVRSIQEHALLEQLSTSVREITIREDFRDQLLRAVNETFARSRRAVKDDLEKFEAALHSLKDKGDRAYDRLDAGEIDKETYNEQRKRLQDEQVNLTSMMKQAQLSINSATGETVKSIIELATNAESLWKHMMPHEQRALLEKLLSNRALDGVTVRYEIVKPLRTLSEMKGDSNWRRGITQGSTERFPQLTPPLTTNYYQARFSTRLHCGHHACAARNLIARL